MQISDAPFDPAHVRQVRPDVTQSIIDNAGKLLTFGRTVFVDGDPAACIGFSVLWPGVAEAWTVFKQGISPTAARQCLYEVRKRLPRIMADQGIHRLQAAVPVSNPLGLRLARALGFRVEGTAEAYGSDRSDYIRFARIR